MTDLQGWVRAPRINSRRSTDPILKHKRRLAYLRKAYGLSGADFDTLVLESGGVCGRCGRQLLNPCIDFDHSTEVVRGLQCRRCILAGKSWSLTPAKPLRVRALPPED
jgi:hypothetical protein